MVYIVQEVPGRNVLPAMKFGELCPLLPPGDIVLSSAPTTRTLQRKLRDFSEADYLLLMGDPSACAIAGAVVAEANHGRFKLLKWDRQQHLYYPVQVDLQRKAITQL
jgi:hypothetical protein